MRCADGGSFDGGWGIGRGGEGRGVVVGGDCLVVRSAGEEGFVYRWTVRVTQPTRLRRTCLVDEEGFV